MIYKLLNLIIRIIRKEDKPVYSQVVTPRFPIYVFKRRQK